MNKIGVLLWLCVLGFLLTLAGCGSDSSVKSSSAVRLAGIVEDGPIEGARITLADSDGRVLSVCGEQGLSRCETISDATGAFALDVSRETDLSLLTLSAIDGKDLLTGVDLAGVEMRAPLALFADEVTAVVISPVTTLVSGLLRQDLPLAAAQARLQEWLLLPPTANLAARPSASLELQKRALLLTHLALELGTVKAFDQIGVEAARENTALLNGADESCQQEVLLALGLVPEAQERVISLQSFLRSAQTTEEAVFIYKREELMAVFAANIEQMLSDPAGFDSQNPGYRENLRLLTEKTLQAVGSEVIPMQGRVLQRIARYILFTYLPDSEPLDTKRTLSPETLLVDSTTFLATLQLAGVPLENDSKIGEIARNRARYSIISPLLSPELPGDDNQLRLDYFYGSDLSPHYLAEELVDRIFDDTINDAVLLKIVEGKATAGLIEEAMTIIATQIMQSEGKAHAYRALGDSLFSFGRKDEAQKVLLLAWELYRAVIEAKGKASASSRDALNLYETAKSLTRAGYLDDAGSVLSYLDEVSQALAGNATAISRLLAGIKIIADAHIAAGDLQSAAPVADLYYGYAQDVPANLASGVETSYWTRVISLGNAAKLYADLNNREMVLQVYKEIEALRTADGIANKTGELTWYLVPPLVESLYRVGATEEALTLANSIPAANVKDQAKAFKLMTTIVALNDSFANAYEMIAAGIYFPNPEDKVEALTYRELSKSSEYIGLALIHAGRLEEARTALEGAEALLAGMSEPTDAARYTYLIRYGYVKVADLYVMMGDLERASALLKAARNVIDQISGVKYGVDGLVEIALGFQQIGEPEIALSLLQEAREKIETALNDPSLPAILPADAALLYESLVKAYLQIDTKVPAREMALFLWGEALDIHTPGIVYTGTANDDLAGKEVDTLLRAAGYLVEAGSKDVLKVLAEAQATADEIIDEDKRLAKYIYPNFLAYPHVNHLIGGYAAAGESDQALTLALELQDVTARYRALHYLANFFIDRDDFPETWVATIDSDGDGMPDFFHPLATADERAASGLVLDSDSDGDGIDDSNDLRPLFAD